MSSTPVIVTPDALFAQAPLPNMNAAASAGGTSAGSVAVAGRGSTIARAAARLSATVVLLVIVGCLPYAATKLISDSGCLRCWPKSDQLLYGASWPSLASA